MGVGMGGGNGCGNGCGNENAEEKLSEVRKLWRLCSTSQVMRSCEWGLR